MYQRYRNMHIEMIGSRIDSLASRFGRRLSVITVGFANDGEDFSVLKNLAQRSKQYGSNGNFFAASLNPEALGTAFSSVSSSLNQTRTELTAIGSSSQRKVRDIRRKALSSVGIDTYPGDDWYKYFSSCGSWDRTRHIYSYRKGKKHYISQSPLHPDATGVALSGLFFGEGAERLVREFRELDEEGRFIGPKLVAKESRFQIDVRKTDRRQIEKFHETYCETQNRAQRLADIFNKKLEQLPCYDPLRMPKISFLDCSIYVVDDKDIGMIGMLVEKQLDPNKYFKWNDNRGAINGFDISQGEEPPLKKRKLVTFDIIEEGDEEEDSSESEDESNESADNAGKNIRPEDIPQAFSHFTYRYTKRKLLVCDLQGVLSDTIPPIFELTDPVIHFRSRYGRKNVFGRTDHGTKGMHNFFSTHKCSPLCKMLCKRWVRQVGADERKSHLDGLEEPRVSNLNL